MTHYGYCRVSAYDRLQSGQSIQAQKEQLTKAGVPPENIYMDGGRSGGVHDDELQFHFKDKRYFVIQIDLNQRKSFLQLLLKLQRGDTLTYVKHDRISRHNAFLDFLHNYTKQEGITLHCIQESNEPLIRKIMGVLAEEELAKTASRNASIQQSIYERGGWAYAAPRGYLKNAKIREGDQRGQLRYPEHPESCLLLHPTESKTVRAVFDAILSGKTPQTAATENNIGLGTVYEILKNKAYTGMTHYGDQWKKTPHVPAIVTTQEYEKAKATVKPKNNRTGERNDD